MSQEMPRASKLALEQVRQHFEAWRKSQSSREPIPEALWRAAVEQSQDYPVYQVSRTLRLDYTVLKDRIESKDTTEAILRQTKITIKLGHQVIIPV